MLSEREITNKIENKRWERVLENTEKTKNWFEGSFGVALSSIEIVGLRKITEQVLEEFKNQEIDEVDSTMKFDIFAEVNARFLNEFYDINDLSILFKNKDGSYTEEAKMIIQKIQAEKNNE
jgi:hypothetical protein